MLKVALNISRVLISQHVLLLRGAPCTTAHSIHPRIVYLRWILLLVKEGWVLYLHVIGWPEKFAALKTALLLLKIVYRICLLFNIPGGCSLDWSGRPWYLVLIHRVSWHPTIVEPWVYGTVHHAESWWRDRRL